MKWRLPPKIKPQNMFTHLLFLQSGGTVMCRRDAVLKYGGSYEHHCTWAEDHYLWLQILLNHEIYYDMTPLFWYHTEESELNGPNRQIPEQLFPFLVAPEPIRRNCPAEYQRTLEKFLAHTAWLDFHRMMDQGNVSAARYLLKQFPLMKSWRWKYIKARIKMAFPELVPLVQAVKTNIPKLK